ncbi:MAG: hypothetical protein H7A34_06355 [bacterium]|nr:hypothetical protein [bacterium]
MQNIKKITSETYLFYAVFVSLALLYIWGITRQRLFPFVDLPDHLAAATIYRYYSDSQTLFKSFYELNTFLKPNVFHLMFCSLPVFASVEVANKVYLCIYAIVFPLSTLIAIRYCKGNKWFALLSFLMLYNFNVMWGFMGYMMAVPLFIITYVSIVRYVNKSNISYAVISMGMMVLLFFVHVQIAVFAAGMLFAVIIFSYRRAVVAGFRKLWIAVPSLFLILFWWHSNGGEKKYGGTLSYLIWYWLNEFLRVLHKRWNLCIIDNAFLFDFQHLDLALIFTLPIIAFGLHFFLFYGIQGIRHMLPQEGKAFALLLGISMVCFFILPHGIPDQYYVYERFSVIFFLAFIIILSVLYERLKKTDSMHSFSVGRLLVSIFIICVCGKLLSFQFRIWIVALSSVAVGCAWFWIRYEWIKKVLFLTLVVIHAHLYNHSFSTFNNNNEKFTPDFFSALSIGEPFTAAIYEIAYKSLPAYIHFPSYYVVWNKGNARMSITDFRFATIRLRKAVSLPPYEEWVGIHPEIDLSMYDGARYIFTRGIYPSSAQNFFSAYQIVNMQGEYRIYEKKQ